MPESRCISIVGAGAWGTTLSLIASDKGLRVNMWTHDSDHRKEIEATRFNSFLPGIRIPETVTVFDRFSDSFFDCILLIVVIDSRFMRNIAREISPYIKKGTIIVSAVKGLEEGSAKTPSTVLLEELDASLHGGLAVLSGPNIAKEIAAKLPAATVIASPSPEVCRTVQSLLSTSYFRIYAQTDRTGVEVGGILKNVIAIAAGICDGLELGSNAKAALITRGMFEIAKLAVHLGAQPSTILGLSGIGDLITTCYSPLSRNYRVGKMLAEGKYIDEILTSLGAVAEGVKTCKVLYNFIQEQTFDLPITEQVYHVLYNHTDPHEAIASLMERSLKFENEGLGYDE